MTGVAERFFAKVEVSSPDQCWLWKAAVDGKGYGRFNFHGNNRGAHRLSRFIFLGEKIPTEKLACHKCNNPTCVNPSHIYFGTALDNHLDTVRAGNFAANNVTHCRQGHDYSDPNIKGINNIGKRYCKECNRRRGRERKKIMKGAVI